MRRFVGLVSVAGGLASTCFQVSGGNVTVRTTSCPNLRGIRAVCAVQRQRRCTRRALLQSGNARILLRLHGRLPTWYPTWRYYPTFVVRHGMFPRSTARYPARHGIPRDVAANRSVVAVVPKNGRCIRCYVAPWHSHAASARRRGRRVRGRAVYGHCATAVQKGSCAGRTGLHS